MTGIDSLSACKANVPIYSQKVGAYLTAITQYLLRDLISYGLTTVNCPNFGQSGHSKSSCANCVVYLFMVEHSVPALEVVLIK